MPYLLRYESVLYQVVSSSVHVRKEDPFRIVLLYRLFRKADGKPVVINVRMNIMPDKTAPKDKEMAQLSVSDLVLCTAATMEKDANDGNIPYFSLDKLVSLGSISPLGETPKDFMSIVVSETPSNN